MKIQAESPILPESKLTRIVFESGLGPSPLFDLAHVIAALLAIGDAGTMGRARMGREVGLGQGSVRTLIGRLAAEGLVKTTQSGCALTDSGMELYNQLRAGVSAIQPLECQGLRIGDLCLGALIKGGYENLGSVTEIRDLALRHGAHGAVIFAYSNNELFLPSMPEMKEPEIRHIMKRLVDIFHPHEGDIILVCGARKSQSAKNALLAVAYSILTREAKI
jgi:predicted transcriptional regulator